MPDGIKGTTILSFLGLGYVGLTHAAVFASKGFEVIGYDVDKSKLEKISHGEVPFYEPGLNGILKETMKEGLLKIVDDPIRAVLDSDVTFITVGTPENPDGSVDLIYVEEASRTIGEALKHKTYWHLVVVKSTVPIGTSRDVVKKIIEEVSGKKAGLDFGLVSNPEFLREGDAIEDIVTPDRIVVGEHDATSGDKILEIYGSFYRGKLPPVVRTSLENAELIKYASNAFLAMKISFMNMIARLCEKIPGADIRYIEKGLGFDKRIGPLFLKAGAGWGGSCLPKDLAALLWLGRSLGVELPLIEATVEINKTQPYRVVKLVEESLRDLRGKRIAVLGLAFKPKTDDMRHAVSIDIVNKLLESGAKVVVYDPKAMENARRIFRDNIEYAKSSIDCIRNADSAIIVTEWEEFKKIGPEEFLENMKTPIIVDGRRIYDPERLPPNVKYLAIGRGPQIDDPYS